MVLGGPGGVRGAPGRVPGPKARGPGGLRGGAWGGTEGGSAVRVLGDSRAPTGPKPGRGCQKWGLEKVVVPAPSLY